MAKATLAVDHHQYLDGNIVCNWSCNHGLHSLSVTASNCRDRNDDGDDGNGFCWGTCHDQCLVFRGLGNAIDCTDAVTTDIRCAATMSFDEQTSAWILPAIEQCKTDVDPELFLSPRNWRLTSRTIRSNPRNRSQNNAMQRSGNGVPIFSEI